jgi:hypothetical protein
LNVKDSTGTSWQIGYMDEYAGTDPNPPVLVIIQGRGAFAGHYGNVMKQGLENGIRVIAPDGDPASASGAVGREGWLDCPGRSADHGGGDAGLPACHDAGHR